MLCEECRRDRLCKAGSLPLSIFLFLSHSLLSLTHSLSLSLSLSICLSLSLPLSLSLSPSLPPSLPPSLSLSLSSSFSLCETCFPPAAASNLIPLVKIMSCRTHLGEPTWPGAASASSELLLDMLGDAHGPSVGVAAFVALTLVLHGPCAVDADVLDPAEAHGP